jgi:hypothetical protein
MRAALIALPLALSACAGFAEQAAFSVSGGGEAPPAFGVSALAATADMPANYAAFNRTDPQAADFHASQICTLGYEKLGERTLTFAPGRLVWWEVRCTPYHLAAF